MPDVTCSRCGQTRAGFEKPPFPGQIGARIVKEICQDCWGQWLRQQTMLINALRSHLSELGVVAAQGPAGVQSAIASLHELQDQWPDLARAALHGMVDQLRDLRLQIEKLA